MPHGGASVFGGRMDLQPTPAYSAINSRPIAETRKTVVANRFIAIAFYGRPMQ